MGFFETFSPRVIHDRESFKDAEHFTRTIQPLEDTEYEWVFAYSNDLCEKYRAIYKELDDKANEIVKYLGGGAGLFTLAVLLNFTYQNVFIIKCAMPSFILSIISVYFAIKSRQPQVACLPPGAKVAFGYANSYGTTKNAQAAFVGEWHRACEGMKLRIDDKANWVKLATWAFFLAILALSVPLIVALCTPRVVP
jgi:hypothetical protein